MLEDKVKEVLSTIYDPEIPALSVLDLGMITAINIVSPNQAEVHMIPTYAACPATSFIQKMIKDQLNEKLASISCEVIVDSDVHWNTNRISELGKQRLKEAGIAPPPKVTAEVDREMLLGIPCPRCSGTNTFLQIPFGYTLCRAIHFCKDCNQSFEQFKPVAND
jgi:ring-1,2-phenylacetyl-CoA epoxidase subunit PaaD